MDEPSGLTAALGPQVVVSCSQSLAEYQALTTSQVFYAPAGSVLEPRVARLARSEAPAGPTPAAALHRRFMSRTGKKRGRQQRKFRRRELEEGFLVLSMIFRKRKRKILHSLHDHARSLALRNQQLDLRTKLALNALRSVLHRKIQRVHFDLQSRLKAIAEAHERIRRETSVAVIREANSSGQQDRQPAAPRVPALALAGIKPRAGPKSDSSRFYGSSPEPASGPAKSTTRAPSHQQLAACAKLRYVLAKRLSAIRLHFWLRLRDPRPAPPPLFSPYGELERYVEERRRIVLGQQKMARSGRGGLLRVYSSPGLSESETEEEMKHRLLPRKHFDSQDEERGAPPRLFEEELSSIMQRSHSLSRSTNIASLPQLLTPFPGGPHPGEFDEEAYKELFAEEGAVREKMEEDFSQYSILLSQGKEIFQEIRDIVQQNQRVANKYKNLEDDQQLQQDPSPHTRKPSSAETVSTPRQTGSEEETV